MLKMNYWTDKWPLIVDVCPCDVHFNDWVAKQKLKNKTIYHFGSGTHHIVGIEQAKRKNRTLCITASKEEYEAYVDLVTGNSEVARNYLCYFGDIYLTNPALLPELDVVTMFHLCEFFFPNTASKEYGGLTDAKLLDLFAAKIKKGGYMVFYKGSIGFDKAKPIIAKWAKKGPVKLAGEFKTLLVYKKK
jgi:hypothetical protein